MDQHKLLSPALHSQMSSFIAEAVAQADLPPLTSVEDRLFIREIMSMFIDAFWQAYVSQLGELTQKQLLEADDDATGEKLWEWMQKNADFENNEGARLLAQDIVIDFAPRLPVIIAEAYSEFMQENQKNS